MAIVPTVGSTCATRVHAASRLRGSGGGVQPRHQLQEDTKKNLHQVRRGGAPVCTATRSVSVKCRREMPCAMLRPPPQCRAQPKSQTPGATNASMRACLHARRDGPPELRTPQSAASPTRARARWASPAARSSSEEGRTGFPLHRHPMQSGACVLPRPTTGGRHTSDQ